MGDALSSLIVSCHVIFLDQLRHSTWSRELAENSNTIDHFDKRVLIDLVYLVSTSKTEFSFIRFDWIYHTQFLG